MPSLWPVAIGAAIAFLFLSWSALTLRIIRDNVSVVQDFPAVATGYFKTGDTKFRLMQDLVYVDPHAAVMLLNNYSQSATSQHDMRDEIHPIAVAIAQREGYPWSDMDWNIDRSDKHRPCGSRKCLYASRSDPSFAYLVARKKLNINEWMKAYEMELNLAEKYHTPILSVARPYILHNISSYMMSVLYAYQHPWDEARHLVVQKVRMAPRPSLLIGLCKLRDGDLRLPQYHRRIEKFGGLVRERGDIESFRETYNEELRKTLIIMQDPKFFSLFRDFQILVDLTGNFYHLDLDREIGRTYKEKKQAKWHKQLKTSMNTVLDWFTEDTSLTGITKRDHEYLEYEAC